MPPPKDTQSSDPQNLIGKIKSFPMESGCDDVVLDWDGSKPAAGAFEKEGDS